VGSLVAAAVPYVRAAVRDPEVQAAVRDMMASGRQLSELRGEPRHKAARRLGTDPKLQTALGRGIGAAGRATARLSEVRPRRKQRRTLVVMLGAAGAGALALVGWKKLSGRGDDASADTGYDGDGGMSRPAGAPASANDAIRPAGSPGS
jgi:hypothetical protein